MDKLTDILTPDLADFAQRLTEHDFKVYVFKSDVERVAKDGRKSCATHLGFSRVVDGRECFGSVSHSLAGYQFHMPMKPSREHGSSMWIGHQNDANEFDDLTIDNAETYASPSGYNPLVGTHANDNTVYARLYIECSAR